MKSTIYIISFDNSDKVYIGQTVNMLESRFKSHISKLKRSVHPNAELQKEFPYLLNPKIETLEICNKSDADTREIYYISQYDSYKNGFNATAGGLSGGLGESHPQAKYALDDYACVVVMLALTNWSHKDISKETGLGDKLISNIATLKNHCYLKDIIPYEYGIMVEKSKQVRKASRLDFPLIVSPDNITFKVDNISRFAKLHDLDIAHLHKVLHGQSITHKGWRLISVNNKQG